MRKEVETPKWGLKYTVWQDNVLARYPVTAEHIGKPLRLASGGEVILVKIHPVGSPLFPTGGYTVKLKGSDYEKCIEFAEAYYKPPRPPRAKRKRRTKSEMEKAKKAVKTSSAPKVSKDATPKPAAKKAVEVKPPAKKTRTRKPKTNENKKSTLKQPHKV